MRKRTGSVLVIGDVVLDCHLYGGVQTGSGPGTRYAEVAGGAALTHSLLALVADVDGAAWEEEKANWQKTNQKLQKAGQALLPKPELLQKRRPAAAYGTTLGVVAPADLAEIPTHFRSYGVWTPRARRKDSKDQVWRIANDFGYGPFDHKHRDFAFGANPEAAALKPDLVVIDDGAMRFRHGTSKKLWPRFDAQARTWYLLKMSRPLCCGDLWEALETVKERLIVVVSANDLRRQDIQINSRLSWEQCAEHTLTALLHDPTGKELRRSAAHVIVTFGAAGALWVQCGAAADDFTAWLLFDPLRLEGEFERELDGTTYGFQTCATVAVAHSLMRAQVGQPAAGPSPFADPAALRRAVQTGLAAGVLAKRELLELGHGTVDSEHPGIPKARLAQIIAKSPTGITVVRVPHDYCQVNGCQWTILSQLELSLETGADPRTPLTGLGLLTARYGADALSAVPALQMGRLHTVDRADIESLRTLDALIRDYERTKVQKKPLCLGVFGPPGAGKSFGVRALAESVLGSKVPFLEFNLSQFKDPEELVGAFHRVRDEVLKGITPVAFWDEFDSGGYQWLQYLLAPMQDGSFQHGEINHPLGKCIFVFAGGTAVTCDTFGVKEPVPPTAEELAELEAAQRAEKARVYQEDLERYRQYKLLKGPDFVSRLHGFLDVLGPNQRPGTDCVDNSWPIRRALLLRSMVGAGGRDELDIDPGLLYALLTVPEYHFGARSFERIVKALAGNGQRRRLSRSDLPPLPLLARDTDVKEFGERLTQADAFRLRVDIDTLASAVNLKFFNEFHSGDPDFSSLPSDKKASNRAAARRIPDHLALIGFVLKEAVPGESPEWQAAVSDAIERHVERLAQAEHLGWCAERVANGWTYDPVRNDDRKQHPLLVPWTELPLEEREKDKAIARWIPDILDLAKHKAVPVQAV